MKNKYSPTEFIKNIYSLILTKITMKQARLIRRPVYIRGHKSIVGGKGLTIGRFCRFDLDGRKQTLYIGDNCEMGDMTHIVAHENVKIGNHVLIASKCFISDTNHGNYRGDDQSDPMSPPVLRKLTTSQVEIGDRVWIGENAVILAGVTVGSGCIIGANSVVTKSVPENCIAAGSPAKVVKKWNEVEGRWIKA